MGGLKMQGPLYMYAWEGFSKLKSCYKVNKKKIQNLYRKPGNVYRSAIYRPRIASIHHLPSFTHHINVRLSHYDLFFLYQRIPFDYPKCAQQQYFPPLRYSWQVASFSRYDIPVVFLYFSIPLNNLFPRFLHSFFLIINTYLSYTKTNM